MECYTAPRRLVWWAGATGGFPPLPLSLVLDRGSHGAVRAGQTFRAAAPVHVGGPPPPPPPPPPLNAAARSVAPPLEVAGGSPACCAF